ncbi:MFS transporter [Geoglobus ahangari]|uniref:MFS transporter n=1 Tax=Geoglobus ahangari TaxID=113653 RepID=UPI00064E9537|nr:MFS transporter [Geoglobus ahangari]
MVQLRKPALIAGFILTVFASQAIWVTFSPVVTHVAEELGTSVEFVGYLAVTYPLFFLLLTMPSGILLDRNFKLWLIFGAALTFLAGAGRLLNLSSYYWLLICQLFGAVGQPFLLNAFVPLATRIDESRRALLVSVFSLSMYLGTIFALIAGVELYRAGGLAFLSLPAALISTAGIALMLFSISTVPEISGVEVRASLASVLRRRDLWVIGILLGLGVAAFDNLATWLQPALRSVGLEGIAGDAVAVSIIAGLIGVAFIPDRISRMQARTRYMRTIIPVIAVLFIILTFSVSSILLFAFLAIAGFLMLPAYPIIMDWIGRFHEKAVHGSAAGFVGLVSRAISVALMFLATSFIYSARAYFAFLTAVILLAMLFALMLPKDEELEKRDLEV